MAWKNKEFEMMELEESENPKPSQNVSHCYGREMQATERRVIYKRNHTYSLRPGEYVGFLIQWFQSFSLPALTRTFSRIWRRSVKSARCVEVRHTILLPISRESISSAMRSLVHPAGSTNA